MTWMTGDQGQFDSQIQDFWQNDTQLYLLRLSVYEEPREIFQKFHSYKMIDTSNDESMHVLSCYVGMNILVIR